MNIAPPIEFSWDADKCVMAPKRPGYACRTYVDGETYRLGIIEERSTNSHNHYFAALHEAWQNLPEELTALYPNEESLRKRALIKAGYHDERSIVCASKAEAQRVAAFVRPMDEYAVVLVSEAVVRVLTAKSQSLKAMGKDEFSKSKQAVLETISAMIGTSPETLKQNSGRAA